MSHDVIYAIMNDESQWCGHFPLLQKNTKEADGIT
jgi:hypothetical protein